MQKKTPKKTSKKELKNKAWIAFSRAYRLRNADENGRTTCYTCGNVDEWQKHQVGHFVPGRGNAVLFNEECVRIQCAACNVFKNGNYTEYTLRMIDEVGREKVEELLALKNQAVKLSEFALEEIRDRCLHEFRILSREA